MAPLEKQESTLAEAYREKIAAEKGNAIAPERRFGDPDYLANGNALRGGSGGTGKLCIESIFHYWEDRKILFVVVFIFVFILFLILYSGIARRPGDPVNLRALGGASYDGGGNHATPALRGVGVN